MLHDVGLGSGHHSLGVGVLPHKLCQLRVLHSSSVHYDMRLVVLADKRLDRLTVNDRHVLGDRVNRLHVIAVLEWDELPSVTDTKNF